MSSKRRITIATQLGVLICLSVVASVQAASPQEILREIMNQQMGESFRMGIQITDLTSKNKTKQFYAWFMGRQGESGHSFFLEFEEPRHAAGMRFLLKRFQDRPDTCSMYLPATKEAVPLSPDMPNFSIGGTGLTADDLPGFLPSEIASATIIREEQMQGAECVVIRIPAAGNKQGKILWAFKDGSKVAKIQQLDAQGKVRRESNTLSFFKTSDGHELPREIEITDFQTRKRIQVRTEHSFLNVEIADELTDSEKFGTHKWKQ